MAKPGVALQSFGNEFINCLEGLKTKREELQAIIDLEEIEKAKLQADIECLSNRLSVLMTSLTKKTAARADFDRAVAESETTLCRLLENAQAAVNLIRREISTLPDDIMKTAASCPINQQICIMDPPPLGGMPDGDHAPVPQPCIIPPQPCIPTAGNHRSANGL